MSLLAATQIPKPADEQAFERASVVLWRSILNDPAVQRNGRRGQRQNGVDLFGIRDGNADWQVGIQCKLKSDGHFLSEDEVRDEVKKAQTFKPSLKEYFIITTAPDDVAMQELAREITQDLAKSAEPMRVFVWGWNTLEERISEDPNAYKAFDPSSALFTAEILAETISISAGQQAMHEDLSARLSRIETSLAEPTRLASPPGDSTAELNAVEVQLDAVIDAYRELNNSGKTLIAMPLLGGLLARVAASASGRILFRIKANIGYCLLALSKDEESAAMLSEAYAHAPTEPKAIANKAFSLLLQGNWQEVLSFGPSHLEMDPSNEWLASYLVQAARFDMSISDPLSLIPEPLHRTAAVQIGFVDFVRRRGMPGEWWQPARDALAMHPAEPQIVQFAAEADLDEILAGIRLQRSRLLPSPERKKLTTAMAVLQTQWDRVRGKDGPARPEDVALCGNLILGLATLDEYTRAIAAARQGLELAPDDIELRANAAVVALEAGDMTFAGGLLEKLPTTADTVALKFSYHASRSDWAEVVALFESSRVLIPPADLTIVATTARLAAIKETVGDPSEREMQIAKIAEEATLDARASVVVADFAHRESMEEIADRAFVTALRLITEDSHVADRMMVAHHASRRGDAGIVADLLDGRVPVDHDSDALRLLTKAFVNDNPIRQRALAFFDRLPRAVRELPYYLHAEGLLHFNRGALEEAEAILRKATAVEPNLDNYLALISILYRLDRDDEVKGLVDGIDLATVTGTAEQKMFLAQVLRKIGEGRKAMAFAYSVLQSAQNDHRAVLRYFGLVMLDPDDGLIPSVETVAVDTWVRIESDRHGRHAFLLEEGPDRPADNVLSPAHPMASAAYGLRVGDAFDIPVAFGETRKWRVAEIKHKYLHALHEVMENFENRFPDADGFYTMTMQDGDIQPALDQVRRVAESNRDRADLYLKHGLPMSFVAAHGGRDSIRFAEYIRFLDFDIRTCLGTEPERLATRKLIEAHRGKSIVLDAYTAWTVSTMDAFGVLRSVFEKLIVPQTVVDEIKALRDEFRTTAAGSMSMTWHNGHYVRQEHSADDIAMRRDFIVEQLSRIETACEIRPVIAPNEPTEVAVLISQSFGSHVLDAANIAGSEHLLVSEDMHYRQYAEGACAAKGAWLQEIFWFALEVELINQRDYADLVVKLGGRRHGHLRLTADTMLAVVLEDSKHGSKNFEAIVSFIGTQDADVRSHIGVSTQFLNMLWQELGKFDLRCMQATSALLRNLIRYRAEDWAFVLLFLRMNSDADVRRYVDGWIVGHFLPGGKIAEATREIEDRARKLRAKRAKDVGNKPVLMPKRRKKHRRK